MALLSGPKLIQRARSLYPVSLEVGHPLIESAVSGKASPRGLSQSSRSCWLSMLTSKKESEQIALLSSGCPVWIQK